MGRGAGMQHNAAIRLRERTADTRPSWIDTPAPGPEEAALSARQLADKYAGWTARQIAEADALGEVFDELSRHGSAPELDALAGLAADAMVVEISAQHGRLSNLLARVGAEAPAAQTDALIGAHQDARATVDSVRRGNRELGDRHMNDIAPMYLRKLNSAARDAFALHCAADPRAAVAASCGEEAAAEMHRAYVHRSLRSDRPWDEVLSVSDFATAFTRWHEAHLPASAARGPRRAPSAALSHELRQAARRNAGAS